MNSKPIHIIAFNIPWPANYGGVIDVFYQIQALHQAGAQIILHCFEYGRAHASELEKYCSKVYYYKRATGLRSNMTSLPYNVFSRRNPQLLENLQKDSYPILFEGLHSCYFLNEPSLAQRIKVIRACNIEQDYYRSLAKVERNLVKKAFFQLEGWRWQAYEPQMKGACHIAAVSASDQKHLQHVFPNKQVSFIPCFHAYNQLNIQPGLSDYVLYHGKLSVQENEQAALYLIKHIFPNLSCRCIIAGLNPSSRLRKAAQNCLNVALIANPSDQEMSTLITQAQIHLLITFQPTGLKLKLLNSLFCGRHVVVNPPMLTGSGLDSLCHIGHDSAEIVDICKQFMHVTFNEREIEQRKASLFPTFSNQYQANRLLAALYPQESL